MWDVRSGQALEDIPISEGDTLSAAFSPDDDTLYTSAGDSALRTWDLTGGRSTSPRRSGRLASLGGADTWLPGRRPSKIRG